jgi:hypothetical protein
MKTTQAWGWLAAGVLALGLNGFYQDGGARWAHQVVERVASQISTGLELSGARADQFLADARLLQARDEATFLRLTSYTQSRLCGLAGALARVQTANAQSEARHDRFEAMPARQEAAFARLEANRVRMEARLAAATARFSTANFTFNPVAFNPVKVPACPRVRVNIPRVPQIKIAAPTIPAIHIEALSAGPI